MGERTTMNPDRCVGLLQVSSMDQISSIGELNRNYIDTVDGVKRIGFISADLIEEKGYLEQLRSCVWKY